MHLKFPALSFLLLFAGLCVAQGLQNAPLSQRTDSPSASPTLHVASWTATKVEHAYGLPESKPKTKGQLTIDNTGLTFVSSSVQYAIPWTSTIAVSNGSERVELFGTTGAFVRMMIPDGGGLAAAAVMHHRVYDLTVEFHDSRGSYHAAVFELPGSDATRVLNSYTQAVPPAKYDPPVANLSAAAPPTCSGNTDSSRTVLVEAPTWGQSEVPAAYRALVYEHIVDRMQHVVGAGHVYRVGEHNSLAACPEYTVNISVVSFKPGSQVKRATLGPIGFFAGTTQMDFRAKITDASGNLNATDQFKTTMRGESQSQGVADGVAKKLAKYYASSVKQYEKSRPAGTAGGTMAALDRP
jgi:hypothetical protein